MSTSQAGTLLWTRWNDEDSGEILVKPIGTITPQSQTKRVPATQIVHGPESGPNGYQGYVLKDGWRELGSPHTLGVYIGPQLIKTDPYLEYGSLAHLLLLHQEFKTGAFLFPGEELDLLDYAPRHIALTNIWRSKPLEGQDWAKILSQSILKIHLACQNAKRRLKDHHS